MRKIILIFSLLFTGIIFANNSLEYNEKNTIKKELLEVNFDVSDSKKSINSIEHTNSDGCFVSCYATATNTVTGESQTFYATSSAESCGVASIMCQSNALSQAMEYIADQ